MFRATIYRLIGPTTLLFCISIALCFVNYTLFVAVTQLRRDSCSGASKDLFSDISEIAREGHHWQVNEKNEAWLVEIAKYKTFNWNDEMERLFQLIPVLEFRTNASTAADSDPIQTADAIDNEPVLIVDDQKSRKLSYASDKIHMEKIIEEIRRINHNFSSLHKFENGVEDRLWESLRKEIFPNGILLCNDIAKMEKTRSNPRIRYNYRSFTRWKGHLQTDTVTKFPVKLRRFQIDTKPPNKPYKDDYAIVARKNQSPYLDKNFEHAKNELLNVLKMQGWYGIPKLLGVCVTTSDGKDVIESSLNGQNSLEPHVIKYLISRHDDVFINMCDDYIPSFQCLQGIPVVALIQETKSPIKSALKFMLNTAKLFSQLQENGAFIYNFIGEHFVFNKNFDVLMTDFSGVRFLAGNHGSEQTDNGLERLLSGTICQMDEQCAIAVWQSNSLSYKFGRLCQESRGYCTSENRCWGLDANINACIMAQWIFSHIHAVTWQSWTYGGNLTNIIECASHKMPERRCSWSDIESMLTDLYEFAMSTA